MGKFRSLIEKLIHKEAMCNGGKKRLRLRKAIHRGGKNISQDTPEGNVNPMSIGTPKGGPRVANKDNISKSASVSAAHLSFYNKWKHLVNDNNNSPVAKSLRKSESFIRGRRAAILQEKGIDLEKKKKSKGFLSMLRKIIPSKK